MTTKTSAPASPASKTLSAALAEDRRREAHRRSLTHGLLLLSGCGGGRTVMPRPQSLSLMVRIHRWGASCLPKSSASPARELDAARRSRTPTPPNPSPVTPTPPKKPCQEAVPVSSPERRPLRESEDTVAEASAEAEAEAEAVAEETGSAEQAATPVSALEDEGGVRVSTKSMSSPQVDSEPEEEEKYFWADKYRPRVLKEFICHKDIAHELYQLVTTQECNNFIFEGPQAVGKRSMALALIRDAFGPDNLKIEECTKRFELKGEIVNHIDVQMKISYHHVEVNLADLHGYEKHIITALLNECLPSPNSICGRSNCRVVVVHDADRLSPDLQQYMDWFLGRYAGCNKILFCCADASNLEAVKHLCKIVTLQPPSFDEIIKVLEYIAVQENIDLPHDLAMRITVSSSNNLRQAIRSFEATWKANYRFTEGQVVFTGWEEEISNVAKKIIEEQSPKQLYIIRGKIKKLIEHNVSPYFLFCVSSTSCCHHLKKSIILLGLSFSLELSSVSSFPFERQHLVAELKSGRDEEFQNSIDDLALEYGSCKDCTSKDRTSDQRDTKTEGFLNEAHGEREAIHRFMKIEEFTVRFMSFYRSLIEKNSAKVSVP